MESTHSVLKSSRTSVLQMSQSKRKSIRLTATEVVKVSETSRKPKKVLKTNKVGATKIGECHNNLISTNTKKNLTLHRKAVMDLLNKGTMKDLQFLPQIGPKTAYQIVTQRYVFNCKTFKI